MENQDRQVPQVVEEKPVSSSLNLVKRFFIVWILIAIFVTAGILYATYYLGVQQGKTAPQATKLSPTIAPSPVPDPTANWKTYTTSEFSIKYPPDWEVKDILKNNTLDWLKTTTIFIGIRPTSLAYDVVAQIRVTTDSPERVAKEGVVKTHNGKTYIFNNAGRGTGEEQTVDQILSTFRFTQ